MGGYGSGRRTGRVCTDQLLKLDVRQLAKHGVLKHGVTAHCDYVRGGDTARVEVRSQSDLVMLRTLQWAGQETDQKAYQVLLESTPCHLGGSRVWFRCPNTLCNRRVAILYGGVTFVCRHCWLADYRCQRETPNDRLFRKIYNLRAKMGWSGGCGYGPGVKPKYMSQKRYEMLCVVHEQINDELDMRAEALLKRIQPSHSHRN